MKKIIYAFSLLLISSTFLSCSDDDDNINNNNLVRNATGVLTLKINDEFRSFGSLNVTEEKYENYSDLVIKGTQTDDNTKTIRIALGKNKLGSDSVYFVQYINNGTHYQMGSIDITADITESNDTKVIGTFSGIVTRHTSDALTITEGIINILY
jgi:hypothetical protein